MKRTPNNTEAEVRRNGHGPRKRKRKIGKYILQLYITGSTPRAKAAVIKVKRFCEEHLKGRYQLDIIDIYQQPHEAKEAQIIAAPTLVRKRPRPLKTLVGDFSQTDRVETALL